MTFSKKQEMFKVGFNETTTYSRSKQDNKYYKEIQIDNIKDLITEDFTLYVDADSLCFKSAAVQDESYITVKNIETGEEQEFKTKTDFKGRARGDKISQDSYLGRENLKREAIEDTLLKVSDFEITQKKRLKRDGSLDKAKIFIDDYIKDIKKQSEIDNLVFLIGKGKVFRNKLPLPQEYKGNRDGLERPILLGEVRDYLFDNYPCEYIDGEKEGIEVDDKVCEYAFEGTLHYRKHGKYNKGMSGIDKDQYGTPALIFNWDKQGVFFKHPQWVQVQTTDKSVGTIEMVGSDCKCSGLLQVCYQMCTSDSADNYSSYLKFPKEMHPEKSYSDSGFFKEFYPLKDATTILQTVADRFYSWFPFGLKYIAWDGEEIDCDTLAWIETLFSCVYMLRSPNDTMTFTKLAEAFKVDLSKVTGNNKLSPPQPTFIDSEKAEIKVEALKELCDNTLSELSGYKSLTKPKLVDKLDSVKCELEEMKEVLTSFYEMKQKEK